MQTEHEKPTTRSRNFWLEIILTTAALSCVLSLVIASVGAAAGTAVEEPAIQASQNYVAKPSDRIESHEGMITDTQCGAKHRAAIGKTASDCARACVHGGAQFLLIDGDSSYPLTGDLDLLKRAAGSRAHIVGVRHGNTITVSSVIPSL